MCGGRDKRDHMTACLCLIILMDGGETKKRNCAEPGWGQGSKCHCPLPPQLSAWVSLYWYTRQRPSTKSWAWGAIAKYTRTLTNCTTASFKELMLGSARWMKTLDADPGDLNSTPGPTPKKKRNRSTQLVLWPPQTFKKDCICDFEFQGYLINLFFSLKAYVFCVLPKNLCAGLSHRSLCLFASFPGAS